MNNPINMIDPDGRAAKDSDGLDHEWEKYVFQDGKVEYQKVSDEGGDETHIEHTIYVGENEGEMTYGGTTETKVRNYLWSSVNAEAPQTINGMLTITSVLFTSLGVASDGLDGFDKIVKSSKSLSKVSNIFGYARLILNTKQSIDYYNSKNGNLGWYEYAMITGDVGTSAASLLGARGTLISGAWEAGKFINNIKWQHKQYKIIRPK